MEAGAGDDGISRSLLMVWVGQHGGDNPHGHFAFTGREPAQHEDNARLLLRKRQAVSIGGILSCQQPLGAGVKVCGQGGNVRHGGDSVSR